MKFSVIALAAATAAASLPSIANAKQWAQFCNDLEGKDGCGISYDMNNPGCFSVSPSAKSVKFHADGLVTSYSTYSLIYSTKTGCNCQVDKQTVHFGAHGKPPPILRLTGKPHASFRWISGSGSGNNC